MKIEFYIPKYETIPVQLRLKAEGKDVYYKRCEDCFGYDFLFIDSQLTKEEALNITKKVGDIMCNQSYDHGQEWRITEIADITGTTGDFDFYIVFRVKLRIKDSY